MTPAPGRAADGDLAAARVAPGHRVAPAADGPAWRWGLAMAAPAAPGTPLSWASVRGPTGAMVALSGPSGLVALRFAAATGHRTAAGETAAAVGHDPARLHHDPGLAAPVTAALTTRHATRGDGLALAPPGSVFARAVWQALLSVPVGGITTYGALAEAVGRPRAARAVGRAVGANPIAVLIPCHRVVRGDGRLGHYTGGVGYKQQLLAGEGVPLAS